MSTLFENNILGGGTSSTPQSMELAVNWYSQTFTPTIAHAITFVKMWWEKTGNPTGNVTVGIRAVDINGKATGADLCSGTVAVSTFPGNSGQVPNTKTTILFGAGTPLSAGTQYAIVIRMSNDNIYPNFIAFWEDTTDSYTGGVKWLSTDSGATWSSLGHDIGFEDWGYTATSTNNQVTTGLRHIYNRLQYNLEITFGGVSVTEPIVQDELVQMAEDAVEWERSTKEEFMSQFPKVPFLNTFEPGVGGGGQSGGSGATRSWDTPSTTRTGATRGWTTPAASPRTLGIKGLKGLTNRFKRKL